MKQAPDPDRTVFIPNPAELTTVHTRTRRTKIHPRRVWGVGSRSRGFSLVETTLAIGLFAFVILPIVGLMQTGMFTFRNSVDRSAGINISNRLMDELSNTSFSNLPTAETTDFIFYNNTLQEVSNPTEAIYVARRDIYIGMPMPNVPRTNNNALRVRVRVVRQPANTHEQTDSWWDQNVSAQEFVRYIPRSDSLRND